MAELLHRTLFLPGPAGRLEALLWSPPERTGQSGPSLAALVCHPHPLFGGTMHNKVVYHTAKTLHRFGLPVLRFNFRGAGLSEGLHDEGRGEQDDVRAALHFLAAEYPGAPLLLAGFSFGSWVGLHVGCDDPRVREMIGIGLPAGELAHRDLSYLDACSKPKLLVSGELDRHGPPEKLAALVERFSPAVKEQTRLALIPCADHFFAGHLSDLDRTIAKWLVGRHPELVPAGA
jgi:alpha/beta superfamily hydrolase